MATRYAAISLNERFEYPTQDVRVMISDHLRYRRGDIDVISGDGLDYWEGVAVERFQNFHGGQSLDVLEKQAKRAGLYTSRGETCGYSQGDYADYLLTSERPITDDDVRLLERWLWGDVWEVYEEMEVTYTTKDGDTVTLWEDIEGTGTIEYMDLWELEQKYPDVEVTL